MRRSWRYRYRGDFFGIRNRGARKAQGASLSNAETTITLTAALPNGASGRAEKPVDQGPLAPFGEADHVGVIVDFGVAQAQHLELFVRHDFGFRNRPDTDTAQDRRIHGFAIVGLHDRLDRDAGLLQGLIEDRARRGARRAYDEILPLQFLDFDRTAPRERVAGVRNDQDAVLVVEPAEEARVPAAWPADNANVEIKLQQTFQDFRARAEGDREPQVGGSACAARRRSPSRPRAGSRRSSASRVPAPRGAGSRSTASSSCPNMPRCASLRSGAADPRSTPWRGRGDGTARP